MANLTLPDDLHWQTPLYEELVLIHSRTIGDERYDLYENERHVVDWRIARLGWRDRVRRELGDYG